MPAPPLDILDTRVCLCLRGSLPALPLWSPGWQSLKISLSQPVHSFQGTPPYGPVGCSHGVVSALQTALPTLLLRLAEW